MARIIDVDELYERIKNSEDSMEPGCKWTTAGVLAEIADSPTMESYTKEDVIEVYLQLNDEIRLLNFMGEFDYESVSSLIIEHIRDLGADPVKDITIKALREFLNSAEGPINE